MNTEPHGNTSIISIPKQTLFELYEVMKELADKRAGQTGEPACFTEGSYCMLLQHCFNAFIKQDYPGDLETTLADYLENIMADYDIIHLDMFIEDHLKKFPPNLSGIYFIALRYEMTYWQFQFK